MSWENTVEPGRPQIAIWRMSIACWVPNIKNTHSEHIVLITFELYAPHSSCLQQLSTSPAKVR